MTKLEAVRMLVGRQIKLSPRIPSPATGNALLIDSEFSIALSSLIPDFIESRDITVYQNDTVQYGAAYIAGLRDEARERIEL